jgi:hypothetical protein
VPAAAPPRDLSLVRTDIAGFAGFAERGPLIVPGADLASTLQSVVKLTSWKDFRLIFGGLMPDGYLAYAVRGFFATGGTTCYVARVAPAASPPSPASLPLPQAETETLSTVLAGPVKPGQTKLLLESSDVVSVGNLILVGEGKGAESFYVSEIVDEQTLGVRPEPEAARQAGTPVYKIAGTVLIEMAMAGQTDIRVASTHAWQTKSGSEVMLVSVEGGGLKEFRVVSGVIDSSTLRLARPLDFSFAADSIVRNYQTALTIRAKYEGEWGNRIRLRLLPLPGQAAPAATAVTEFSLRVSVDASRDSGQPIEEEFYPHLSVDPATKNAPVAVFASDVIRQSSQLIRLDLNPVAVNQGTGLPKGIAVLEENDLFLEGGSDGTVRGETTTQDFRNSLDALAKVDEIAILCCPDAAGQFTGAPQVIPPPPPGPCDDARPAASAAGNVRRAAVSAAKWSLKDVQAAMLEQCYRLRYRVAVLDTPPSKQPAQIRDWLDQQTFDRDEAKFGAVYYPWLKVPDDLAFAGPNRLIPPSGHIAGAFAYNDSNFGVRKPPANVELQFISDLEREISNEQQGPLNERGINVIRAFPGRGIRVWGARSISSDPAWKFIHTRRLLSMIEDSVEKSSRWTVYEPNDDNLRNTLTHSLNVFLEGLWRSGGLKGQRPEQGFFVKCDSTNNPQPSIDAGFLICQVGVAIAAPMEFIVFEMRRSVAGPQVVEA